MLLLHSKCNSLHLPTPNSQSSPLPPLLPMAITSLISTDILIFLLAFKTMDLFTPCLPPAPITQEEVIFQQGELRFHLIKL